MPIRTTIKTVITATTVTMIMAMALVACDNKADTTPAPTTAPAAATPMSSAATPAAPAPAPAADAGAAAAPSAADAERAKLAAMMNVYPDEAAWNKACLDDKVDAKICECTGKATVKTIGAKGLYAWVWQAYVNRDATARMRSNSWFTENGIDKAGQQKFADAVGKCYTT
jgi:hypothetical protein